MRRSSSTTAIIELPSLAEPTLIDPALLGVLYVPTEPCSWICTRSEHERGPNTPGVRCDVHVRNVAGCYVIEKEGE